MIPEQTTPECCYSSYKNKLWCIVSNKMPMPPTVSIVVAFSTHDFAIGRDGGLPWGCQELPGDLQRLKEITHGGVVVMGSRTYASIPYTQRPLAGRLNVVITRSPPHVSTLEDGVVFIGEDELDIMYENADPSRPWYILGGERLYSRFMGRATTIHATLVDSKYDGCDRFFPHKGSVHMIWLIVLVLVRGNGSGMPSLLCGNRRGNRNRNRTGNIQNMPT